MRETDFARLSLPPMPTWNASAKTDLNHWGEAGSPLAVDVDVDVYADVDVDPEQTP